MILLRLALYAAAIASIPSAVASETVTPEPDHSAYHFVSHFSVDIEASAEDVWPQLRDLGSWMYEFDLTLESGEAGEKGEVRRLYAGQDFFIQVTRIIPEKLLVFANLPSSFNGEHSTGVAIISITEAGGTSTVSLTMSRRYRWDGEGENPNMALRESDEFQERTRSMWQDRFLGRLKSLVESR